MEWYFKGLVATNSVHDHFTNLNSLPFGPLLSYLDCFQKLAKVKHACFGMKLDPGYSTKIKEFKQAYLALNIRVTPCTHILFEHVEDFLRSSPEVRNQKKGLGFYSEQSFESIHRTMSKTLERFSVNSKNDKQSARILRAMCALNASHI